MKRKISVALMVLLLLASAFMPGAKAEETVFTLKKNMISIKEAAVGKAVTLLNTKAGNTYKIQSNDNSVVVVDATTTVVSGVADGDAEFKINAVNYGTATVTITEIGADAKATGNVETLTVNVYCSKFSYDDVTLAIGKTQTLVPKFSTGYTFLKAITYKSADSSIATVKNGVVTAVKRGSTVVTARIAKANNVGAKDDVTAEFTVKVVKPVTTILIDKTEQYLYPTKTVQITAYPNKDATVQTLKYTSMDTKIATVSKEGKIKGIAPGKTTVTVEAMDDSGLKKEVTVYVVGDVTKLAFADNAVKDIAKGHTVSFPLSVVENNNFDTATYTATVDYPNLAKVSIENKNVTVTGVATGYITVTVTATNLNGTSVTTTHTINICKEKTQKLKITKIKSVKASSLKKKSKKIKLKVKAYRKPKLSYKVTKGKKKYISVSKSGTVTLKKKCKAGTYKVTVYAAKTNVYKSAKKVVTIKVK